jgi:NAD-dependent malate dehydrogenase
MRSVSRVQSRSLLAGLTGANQQCRDYRVAVIGAAGGIGQPLSLLMKNSALCTQLALYDVAPITPGVAVDLSHIPTGAKVEGHQGGADALNAALTGCDVVIIPAGIPRKPGMTRDDLFNINAGIVANTIKGIATQCPNAAILIISNPVNSTVPIAREVLKKAGAYNPKKLFGVTTLDLCRAEVFVAENQGWDVVDTQNKVPVIGGHAGVTIQPLLSQVKGATFSDEDLKALTPRIQDAGTEVVAAKAGGGSATLSMAWAGARLANSVLRALDGEDQVEYSFVESSIVPGCDFFSSPVVIGKDGVKEVRGYGDLTAFEQANFDAMVPELIAQVNKGVEWGKNFE